jgi:hypothetical protein
LVNVWLVIALTAQSAQGDREFELSGNASSGNEFNTNNFGASASLSYYFTGSQEIGLRHGINVASLRFRLTESALDTLRTGESSSLAKMFPCL